MSSMRSTVVKRKSGKKRSRGLRNNGFHIPSISSNVVVKSHTFRFLSTAAYVGTITSANIIAACGSICTIANTSGTNICQTFKLKKVQCWAPPPSQGTASTCSIEWSGVTSATSFTSSLQVSDTSINPSSPAFVQARPPRGSAASFWQVSGTANIFNINVPTGTVIDLELEYVLLDDQGDLSVYTYTSGAATLGNIYYVSLNGGTHTLNPVSLSSNY